MSHPKRLQFVLSRRKLALALLGCALALGASSVLAFYDLPSSGWALRPLGWGGMILFGMFAGFAMSKILLGGAALVIEQEGITDFSSGLAAGHVPWAEIAGFGPIAFGEQRFLGIAVRDAGVLKSRLSGLKARAVDWNLAHGLPHILIPQVVLKQDVEAVAKSMRDFVDTHNLLSGIDEQSAS